MHITTEINDYVLAKAPHLAPVIYEDGFPGNDPDELMSRVEPGTAKESRYLSGTRVGSFTLAYYGKGRDIQAVRGVLDAIVGILDWGAYVTFGAAKRVKIEPVTETTFVSRTDRGESVYSATFRVEYYREA